MAAPAFDPHILADQKAYYRARAGEYDEWWFRQGRYDRGADINALWFDEVQAVESALMRYLDTARPRTVLELACGTGLFTRHLAPRVERLTAVDASSEVIEINRERVRAANVDYVVSDLFEWTPTAHYDLVFMSFWLSHVPIERFDAFWSMVRDAMRPDGAAYVIDSALEPTSGARNQLPPNVEAGVSNRKLNDGRQFLIVKIYHEPQPLNDRLARLGFEARITRTPRYFIYGDVRRAGSSDDGSSR